MFEITRKVGETIKIGEEIRITILAINGETARIAVFDPKRKIPTKAGTEKSDLQEIPGAVRSPLIAGDWLTGKSENLTE